MRLLAWSVPLFVMGLTLSASSFAAIEDGTIQGSLYMSYKPKNGTWEYFGVLLGPDLQSRYIYEFEPDYRLPHNVMYRIESNLDHVKFANELRRDTDVPEAHRGVLARLMLALNEKIIGSIRFQTEVVELLKTFERVETNNFFSSDNESSRESFHNVFPEVYWVGGYSVGATPRDREEEKPHYEVAFSVDEEGDRRPQIEISILKQNNETRVVNSYQFIFQLDGTRFKLRPHHSDIPGESADIARLARTDIEGSVDKIVEDLYKTWDKINKRAKQCKYLLKSKKRAA